MYIMYLCICMLCKYYINILEILRAADDSPAGDMDLIIFRVFNSTLYLTFTTKIRKNEVFLAELQSNILEVKLPPHLYSTLYQKCDTQTINCNRLC